jgi:hypothetical protein
VVGRRLIERDPESVLRHGEESYFGSALNLELLYN